MPAIIESIRAGLVFQLKEAVGAALIREREDGTYKVSLRSRGEIDIEKIARQHGGGGHRNAAGFALEGDGEEVRRRVVEMLAATLSASDEAAAVPAGPADGEE